jgi:hypothetical protein
MGAPADTNLTVQTIRVTLATIYKRIDKPVVPQDVADNIEYVDISKQLVNGRGTDKANLQYHSRRRLVDASETFDLDGVLVNVWQETLDYDAVKIIIIRNRETANDRFLQYGFKNEAGNIGPQGARLILEPGEGGVEALTKSGSSEEGLLTITADGDITYDLIIIGADSEESSTTTSGN